VAKKGMPDWALPGLEWRREREHKEEETGAEGAMVALHGGRAAAALGGELTRTLELERRK
jgi:hypothetical protein